mgnify:CR=1 FL=1
MDLMAIAGIIQGNPLGVVEIGTGSGGSALFWRDAGAPIVWTIDVQPPIPSLIGEQGIEFIQGDSLFEAEAFRYAAHRHVILDGDHRKKSVLAELYAYAHLVDIGAYLIVCDTHFNGHPIAPEFGQGPWEAVEAFLAERDDFVQDREVEPLFTFNPGGYLRRVK